MNASLLWSFARQELVDRYAGSALGFGWAFLQPIVTLFIYVVIFGHIMSARLPGVDSVFAYSVYLVAGMLPWMAFSNTLVRATSIFVERRGILTKVNLSLAALPVFIVLAESITFFMSLALFLALLPVLGFSMPKPHVLLLPWIFLIQQLLALGLGMFFAVLNVFLRDLREFVTVLVQLWFWVTPIAWVPQILPPGMYDLLSAINPMAAVTGAYQSMFVGQTVPDYHHLAWVAFFACVILGLGYAFMKHLERDLRDFL